MSGDVDAEALQENLEAVAKAINELQTVQDALVRLAVALAKQAGVEVPEELEES